MVGDEGFELGGEMGQPVGQRRRRVGLKLAVADVTKAVAVGLNHAPAGGAEPGVEAEDDQASFSNSSSGTL
jgi:hypothetical protein